MAPGGPGRVPEPSGQRLPKHALIRSGREIREVLKRGRRFRTPSLDVFVMTSPAHRPRLGFVVPKAGHRIVERNRLKRRLREIARTRALTSLFEADRKDDVLVRARKSAYERSQTELEDELMGVVEGLCSLG